MKQVITAGLALTIILPFLASCSSSPKEQTDEGNDPLVYTAFFCETGEDGVPTTFHRTTTGLKRPFIRWEKKWEDEQYTAQRRCEEVTANLQQAHQDEVLEYLTTGIMNNRKVICATTNFGGSCQQMLFTLREEDDPETVIEELMESAALGGSPFTHSNGTVSPYYKIVDS